MTDGDGEDGPRPVYFAFEAALDAFEESFRETLQILEKEHVRARLSEENTHRYTHGRAWAHYSSPEMTPGEFKTLSVELAVRFDDLVNHNMSIIPETLFKITTEFHKQFWHMIYSSISETCERTGNSVDAKQAGGVAAAFMDALRKIEFGVDRKGNISLPEIHVGSNAEQLLNELKAQPPNYHAEIERLKVEKTKAALKREAERKARFKRYGDQ